jgi:hypothetical protein
MRYVALLALVCGVYELTASGGTVVANGGPSGIRVIWAVPTNVWPVDKLWIYKVLPQNFPQVVISNVMAVGSFTRANQRKTPADLLAVDPAGIRFSGVRTYLEILPTLGYIKYYNENAEARMTSAIKNIPEPVVGVPNQDEATRLGLIYLRLLGIDSCEIARKPGSSELDLHWERTTRGWIDQKTKKEVDEVQGFGVHFTRCLDGVPISGFGDFSVSFGNEAKVRELEVSWRNLEPYRLLDKFVTPKEIVESIQSGGARLPRLEGWPLDEVKTLTITNATPRYTRKPGDEPMDFVSPALQLDAIMNNGKTNKYIWFQMGILPHGT